jgi:gliding motility-associated lipoprotein GldD
MRKRNKVQWQKLFVASVISLLLLLFFLACGNDTSNAVPKPRTYPRVDFPVKEYKMVGREMCRFAFEMPVYAEIEDYSGEIEGVENNHCWFDIVIPEFNGKIHCSYYEINKKNSLDSLIYDSFTLVGKHTIKAQYIKETRLDLKDNVSGVLFNLTGPAASPTQFFLTDSTRHFLRGSLYFENKTQVDSMQIIYDFVNRDIEHILNTFHWK